MRYSFLVWNSSSHDIFMDEKLNATFFSICAEYAQEINVRSVKNYDW